MNNRSKKTRPRAVNKRNSLKPRWLEPVVFLADFLNSQPGEELQKWTRKVWRSGWLRSPERYQAEVIKDLQPIIEPIEDLESDEAVEPGKVSETEAKALCLLLKKINGLKLTASWEVWPGREKLSVYSGGRRRVSVVNPIWSKLGTAQATYRDWLISMHIDDGSHPRQFLYGLIASALQSGALECLGRCRRKECRKFFVSEDRRRWKYCSRICGDAVEEVKARKRAEESRINSSWRA